MTTHGNMAAHQQERVQGAKGHNFFWGKEFVPESGGAGSLFQSLFWLAKELYEGQMLDLAKLTKRLSPSRDPCVGAGNIVVVAVYFLFNHRDDMDILARYFGDRRAGLYYGLAL
ncbi:hypothetical protein HRG_002125 [Hirsutella rhossiliensis]|uniref:Uncharacterized protein n=1 Tax=Hirsutella rhossiliensis TaxID=111463 RepID=A0A9P8N675_9HYPO|nr:uncharacterized protein HRG_02125 [Hirsutella rhossiliensis]KAH0966716.1 hypothetical protein HRG_02125 [Hirsutella rhossiliensis]